MNNDFLYLNIYIMDYKDKYIVVCILVDFTTSEILKTDILGIYDSEEEANNKSTEWELDMKDKQRLIFDEEECEEWDDYFESRFCLDCSVRSLYDINVYSVKLCTLINFFQR